ncbi:glycosyltransferase family 4 protein [Microbacterium soli]
MFDITQRAACQLGYSVAALTAEPRRNPLSYVYSLRNRRRAKRFLQETRPDVVHVQNYYHFHSPSILSAIRTYKRSHPEVRVVFTAHDYHLICPNSGFQHFTRTGAVHYDVDKPRIRLWHNFDARSRAYSLLKLLQHMVAYRLLKLQNVFDVIISPSELVARAFRAAGITADIKVIRNPVDVPGPSPVAGSGLVFLNRLKPEKGLIPFITALEKEHVECTIDVYGDGPEKDSLINLANSCTSVRVTVHGHIPHAEVPYALARHQALVYPSTWIENAPMAVIEAASLGLSLVVPHWGGVLEMAELAEYQHAFDPASSRSIAQSVAAALNDPHPNRLRDPRPFELQTYVNAIQRTYDPDARHSVPMTGAPGVDGSTAS